MDRAPKARCLYRSCIPRAGVTGFTPRGKTRARRYVDPLAPYGVAGPRALHLRTFSLAHAAPVKGGVEQPQDDMGETEAEDAGAELAIHHAPADEAHDDPDNRNPITRTHGTITSDSALTPDVVVMHPCLQPARCASGWPAAGSGGHLLRKIFLNSENEAHRRHVCTDEGEPWV